MIAFIGMVEMRSCESCSVPTSQLSSFIRIHSIMINGRLIVPTTRMHIIHNNPPTIIAGDKSKKPATILRNIQMFIANTLIQYIMITCSLN